MYFVLAAVGLFTLLVGAFVRVRRPRDQATLHFFWLCVAFFGVFTFSFSGPFDRLDWVFYWGDAVAFALLPPLLLHFTLVFPDRPAGRSGFRSPLLLALMYVPGLVLGAARIVVVARGASDGAFFSRALNLLDRAEHVYLFVCARRRRSSCWCARSARSRRGPAGVSCGGSRGERPSVSGPSRSATRCRGRSASIHRSRCN